MSNITDKLLQTCAQVLRNNDCGHFTAPAAILYPHQWLWDSCFTAIGLRHLDVERAQLEITSLLHGQWHNGMVPHMIFTNSSRSSSSSNKGGKVSHDWGVWHSWISPMAPDDTSTSGITQPPMLAEAITRIGEKLSLPERRSWYKQVYPQLVAYHEWLYTDRDPHDEGLVLLVHPWESGLDNTPPWMAELHRHLLPWWVRVLQTLKLDALFTLLRADTRYISKQERATNTEALALYAIQRRLRRERYDTSAILNRSIFAVEDVVYNSIFIRANQQLEEIAKTIRQPLPEALSARIAQSRTALEKLWDPYTAQYYSRDFSSHRLLKEQSVATLLPLYAGSISQERANTLVKLLENDKQFGTAYPIPSVPVGSPQFDARRYWQGPTWININWLIIDGLKRYGFDDHAAVLTESTLEMIDGHGIAEYYDPLNGDPLGADNFSWTAALAIDLIKT